MSVIICIGEKQEDHDAGKTNEVCASQLNALLEDDKVKVSDWSRIVIAYEPVWAIGTGKAATPEIAQDAHMAVRAWVAQNVNQDVADEVRILYGGSVNDKNAATLIAKPDIDGFLIGGAALKPAFSTIVSAVNSYAL